MTNSPQTPISLRARLKEHEREIILEAMELNSTRIAQERYLGIPSTTLWRKLTAHGLIGPDAPA
jgi:DNA-binding NtrC family response regulator